MIKKSKLDFWIKNNLNVLMRGRHGVGKTSMIVDAYERNKIKYLYFSAATMDPWVDFIGVPKANEDEKGAYLDFILPKELRDDQIEAIFFDELNRAHKKVLNAILELIQFKTINGRPFPRLQIIWAACNPKDDEDIEYDVEALDPALEDRFHVQVDIPYEVHKPYFTEKFGKEWSSAACSWWTKLEAKDKLKISPRRLEAALDIHKIKDGDIRDIIPLGFNITELVSHLQFGDPQQKIKNICCADPFSKKDLCKFLSYDNNINAVKDLIGKDEDIMKKCIHFLDPERIIVFMTDYPTVQNYALNKDNLEDFMDTITEISHSGNVTALQKRCKSILSNRPVKTVIELKNLISTKKSNTHKALQHRLIFKINPFIIKEIENIEKDLLPANKKSDFIKNPREFYFNKLKTIICDYNTRSTGSQTRDAIMQNSYNCLSNKINLDEAHVFLKIVDHYIGSSKTSSIIKLEGISLRIIAQCMSKLCSEQPSSHMDKIWLNTIESYPSVVNYICERYSNIPGHKTKEKNAKESANITILESIITEY